MNQRAEFQLACARNWPTPPDVQTRATIRKGFLCVKMTHEGSATITLAFTQKASLEEIWSALERTANEFLAGAYRAERLGVTRHVPPDLTEAATAFESAIDDLGGFPRRVD